MNEKAERILDFKNMNGTGLKCFRRIKKLCFKEEWPEIRDELINSVKDRNNKCELLPDEKLYDRLYESVFEKTNIQLLNKFGFILIEDYSDAVLKVYTAYVETLAESACNRSRYNELLMYLKRMKNYKDGKKRVANLANKWIAAYPTRKVMIKELESLTAFYN